MNEHARPAASPLGLGIIGCGNIAASYARELVAYPGVTLVGVADQDQPRAAAFAATYGCRAYPSVAALLDDDAIVLVVNLTTHHAHYAVSTQCLNAGKHVYSEKPLALTPADAWALVALAERRGLRLGCSPATLLGEAQQTAWRIVRDGELGPVRVVYAEVNWGRIETWHPAPEPFYDVGVLFDVGVYPLMLLTAWFGPARRVWAHGTVLLPTRETKTGVPFVITKPDLLVALVELGNGVVVRLTCSFYVGQHSKQSGIEVHGDQASLALASWLAFDSPVEVAPFGKAYAPVPPTREPFPGVIWSRGVQDLVEALRDDRPHRLTGAHAAHVVEILCAITTACQRTEPVLIESSFTLPAPL